MEPIRLIVFHWFIFDGFATKWVHIFSREWCSTYMKLFDGFDTFEFWDRCFGDFTFTDIQRFQIADGFDRFDALICDVCFGNV